MRILFIDDRVEDISVYKDELEVYGHSVEINEDLDWAYRHLSKKENQLKYDIVFIDEDFQESNHKTKLKSGEDLISNLALNNLLCPLVYFSSVMDSISKVTEILGALGVCYFFNKSKDFDGKEEECIQKVISLPSYKRIIQLRSNTIDGEIKDYFNNLRYSEALTWQEEVYKGIGADWTKFNIPIGGLNITIQELLYNPIQSKSTLDISNIIEGFLTQTNRVKKFSSYFIKDAKEEYNKYIKLNRVSLAKEEGKIDEIASNYFVNTLSVLKQFDQDGDIISLNTKNRSYSRATEEINKTSLSKGSKTQLFRCKMALRRVAALFYYCSIHIGNFITFDEEILACLLKEGWSHPKRRSTGRNIDDIYSPNETKTVWTRIGLSKALLNSIKTEYDYPEYNPFIDEFLDSERLWVFEMANKLPKVTNYLDSISHEFLNDTTFVTCLPSNKKYISDLKHLKSSLNSIWLSLSPSKKTELTNILSKNLPSGILQLNFKSGIPEIELIS